VERTDWLDEGFDAAQAQFLMVTAITHHRFSSPLWGEDEVRKLQVELAEIAAAAAQITTPKPSADSSSPERGSPRWPGGSSHPAAQRGDTAS
jgi:hypothetical protein